MRKKLYSWSLLIAVVVWTNCTKPNVLPYLNQNPPGQTPVKFAPDLISMDDQYEFGSVFSRDGTEFFYGVDVGGRAETRYMKIKDNQWTKPEVLLTDDIFSYNDPFLSPDERRLFFISDRPLHDTGAKKDYDIWFIERNNEGWSEPINADTLINSGKNEYYISFAKNGSMYFSSNVNGNFDIYASRINDTQFQPPVRLDSNVNTEFYEADVFVAYDESYLIFCADRPEGFGHGDLYISFKKEDGSWTEAKNMGNTINTNGHELCPFVTKDGKYLFYTSNKDIYWVNASILNQFK